MNPFWLNLSQKKSFLVRSDILRLLLNTLIFNDKYSHSNMENLWQQIHIELSQKLKTFCQTLIAFLESTLNLQHFEKKSLIAQAFLKFLNLTELLTYIHKRSSFWKSFASEHVYKSQKLLKSAEKYFYPTFSSFWGKLSWKKSLLVRSEILGLFVNTMRTSMLLVIGRIYWYQFKCNYLKNYIGFLKFYCIFWIYMKP